MTDMSCAIDRTCSYISLSRLAIVVVLDILQCQTLPCVLNQQEKRVEIFNNLRPTNRQANVACSCRAVAMLVHYATRLRVFNKAGGENRVEDLA